VFLAAAAMLVLAFSPALLFKFVPMLPSSATSYGAGRPSIAGAAMVAGTGAAVGSMIRNRRISQNQSGSAGAAGVAARTGGTGRGPAPMGGDAMSGLATVGGGQGNGAVQPTSRAMARQGQGVGGPAPDARTLGEMQRDDRAGTATGRAANAIKTGSGRGTASVARGSAKVAAGGATAFLLAGREGARQAALRGRQGVNALAPDTDHISGR
jgi:hypothetical protein